MTVLSEPFAPLGPQDPQTVAGYRLHARLGGGGMGQVFLSFTPGGRPVAVKIVRSELADDQQFRARFGQEVRAAQQVNGIYIAQLLDADPAAPTPWLATAYVPGPSLAEAVRVGGPLPPDTVRKLATGTAEALRAIHAAGIVHRDLKPGNVVIAADGPRVIDFGIARAADATPLTLSGVRIGTPQYTSPEQIHGRSATEAADMFALGALAYFAATGQPAFGEGPEFGVVYRIVNDEPDLAGCPPDLLDIIRACLAKEPADRPTTADVIEAWRSGTDGAILPGAVHKAIKTREAAVTALRSGPGGAPTGPAAAPQPPPSAAPTAVPGGPPGPQPAGTGPQPAGTGPQPAGTGPQGFGPGPQPAGPGPQGFGPGPQPAGAGAWTAPPGPPPTPAAAAAVPGGGGPRGGSRRARRFKLAASGAVVLLAAVLGAVGWNQLSDMLGDEGGGAATQRPGPAGAAGGQPSAPATTPATTPPDKVQWNGPIRFGTDGIDLDPVPPRVGPNLPTGQVDLDYSSSAPGAAIGNDNLDSQTLAKWTGSAAPTRQQCADLVSTQGVDEGTVATGDQICLTTDEDRVAVLKIESVNPKASQIRGTVSVWEAAVQPTG